MVNNNELLESVKQFYETFITGKKKDLSNEEIYNLYTIPKKDKGKDKARYQPIPPNVVQQVDLLFMPDDKGYRYALVVADVGSRKVDAEPIKNKSSDATVQAIKKIYQRGILKKPQVLQCDPGGEFKGQFKKYCDDNNISIRYGKAGRHRQQGIVESANKRIGASLHKRMTAQELLTGFISKDWIKDMPKIIKAMNVRATKRKEPKEIPYPLFEGNSLTIIPIGTPVRIPFDEPRDVTSGKRLHGTFRSSDIRYDPEPRKVINILLQPNQVPLYIVSGINGVAYTRNQLQVIPEDERAPPGKVVIRGKPEAYIVDKIENERGNGKKRELLIKWKGWEKATWEPYDRIKKDVPHKVQEFINSRK